MKINNNTKYRSDQLRALITAVAANELNPAHRARMVVTVVTCRGPNVHGRAHVPGNSILLKLPVSGRVDPVNAAWVIAHEFAHARGLHHSDMRNSRYSWQKDADTYYGWASAYPIEVKAARPKPDQQVLRYERVLASQKRWTTKLKRAQTALKKLGAQRRRYETVLAASGKLPVKETK